MMTFEAIADNRCGCARGASIEAWGESRWHRERLPAICRALAHRSHRIAPVAGHRHEFSGQPLSRSSMSLTVGPANRSRLVNLLAEATERSVRRVADCALRPLGRGLRRRGEPVVPGAGAHRVEISRARSSGTKGDVLALVALRGAIHPVAAVLDLDDGGVRQRDLVVRARGAALPDERYSVQVTERSTSLVTAALKNCGEDLSSSLTMMIGECCRFPVG